MKNKVLQGKSEMLQFKHTKIMIQKWTDKKSTFKATQFKTVAQNHNNCVYKQQSVPEKYAWLISVCMISLKNIHKALFKEK